MEKEKAPQDKTPPAAVMDKGQMLKNEMPEASTATSAPVMESKPTPTAPAAKKKLEPFKLFGRIDQLSGSAGASFPQLKAMTPKLDSRGVKPLQARAVDTTFSGNVIRSFPINFQGTWGGNLQLQVVQMDPTYYQVDPQEATRTQQAMRVGSTGAVNFQFQNVGQRIALEPARVMFMVPSQDTEVGAQLDKMFGGANAGMGDMVKQMVKSMPVPVMLEFGEINTSNSMGETGVSGNQLQAHVLKNVIRQLAPNVLEQQIVTQETTWNKQTGQPRTGYGETVLRFTMRNAQQMYAQAASVNYGSNKHFLMKVVLGGWVTKGQVMNTDPMGAMGGMGNMQQLFGQPGQQSGGMPQLPGLDPNMLKNLMGH
jgi:hypothetical protein